MAKQYCWEIVYVRDKEPVLNYFVLWKEPRHKLEGRLWGFNVKGLLITELLEKGHRGEILKYQTRYVSLWATKSVAKLNFFVKVSSQKLAMVNKR